MRFEPVSGRSSLGQLLPPLLLFLVPLATSGTALVAGCLVAAVALAYSLARLVALRLRARKPGARALRAVLTVVFAGAVLVLSWLQAAPVYRYVDGLSRHVQAQCRAGGECPARIAGWRDVSGGSDAEMGARVRYPLAYRSDGRTFRLCWVAALGRCRAASGGVGVALRPVARWPWPAPGADGRAP